ncbi:MAG: sigma 54-interacting transcriptional regulator [Deltaproteobacteria bacterium]|nr:sigma 54-interacting transcriptional regulator [Deltaproteobacteria bacterium]
MLDATLANTLFVCSADGKLIYSTQSLGDNLPIIFKHIADFVNKNTEPMRIERLENGTLEIEKISSSKFNGIIAVFSRLTTEDEHWRIAELKKSVLELNGVFETSRDGMVVADEQGIFCRLNSSYTRISGLRQEQIIGRSGSELVALGLISQSATEQVLISGNPVSVDQKFPLSQRNSYITASPLYDNSGKIFRIVTNVRDTTELHNLRLKLSRSQARLSQYSQIVKTLTQEKGNVIFRSSSMRELRNKALRFSQTDYPVLLLGETGVGKEVIADFLHSQSPRSGKTFLKINCSSIPEYLLESELFGYVGGAFTGANKQGKIGLFEMADKGTLLLDEIGEMPLPLQAKLLRFVENQEFYKIGGKTPTRVDVRLLAATNRNLEELVKTNTFRKDLLYRLKVLYIDIPPLRERKEDILPLVQYFLEKTNQKYGHDNTFHPDIFTSFMNYSWPGNVRELEHLVERLVIMSDTPLVSPAMLPQAMVQESSTDLTAISTEGKNYQDAKEEFERVFWRRVENMYPTYRQAAKALGVTHVTVMKKLRRYGSLRDNPQYPAEIVLT